MPKSREKYMVYGVDLSYIRNRNEVRVAQSLADLITERGLSDLPDDIIRDTYAYALNTLPSRYAQHGTIVLRDPIRKEQIDQVVDESLQHILSHPKS